jgi:hypothetical protein
MPLGLELKNPHYYEVYVQDGAGKQAILKTLVYLPNYKYAILKYRVMPLIS